MLVVEQDLEHIPTKELKPFSYREYTVKLLEERSNNWIDHTFQYPEKPFKQFTFDKGFAISGSHEHGLFGIVDEHKFYHHEFSKDAVNFINNSDFWKPRTVPGIPGGGKFDLTTDGIKEVEFDEPINLWFNIQQYWHWFFEDLPLIEGFRDNHWPIITNKLKPWQQDSLTYFPDIIKRVVEVDTPCVVKAPKYYTYTYPATSYRGKANSWVGEFLRDNLKSEFAFPFQKVYISRGDAAARCVDNEDEVKRYLSEQGFVCYDNFSNLDISEKINVFGQAKIVISPTGAGLTHVHAMPKGGIVIDFNHHFELKEECGWNNLADVCGLKWYTFPAITTNDTERSKQGGVKAKNKNLMVDINTLHKVLCYVEG